VLKRLHLVVRLDTVLRWHRDMVAPVGFQMVYKRLTCGFACGAGRVDGSVAGLWSYGPVALDLWS